MPFVSSRTRSVSNDRESSVTCRGLPDSMFGDKTSSSSDVALKFARLIATYDFTGSLLDLL
jgi:hypothetical protein